MTDKDLKHGDKIEIFIDGKWIRGHFMPQRAKIFSREFPVSCEPDRMDHSTEGVFIPVGNSRLRKAGEQT